MYILSLTCAPLRCALGSSRRLRKRKLTRWRRVVRVRGRGELRRAEKEFFGAVGRVGVGAEQELFFFQHRRARERGSLQYSEDLG